MVELLDFYHEPSTDDERLAMAQNEKEKGNAFFASSDYASAIQCYEKASRGDEHDEQAE